MTDLLSFNFDLQPVRVIMRGDDPWWIAGDIADVLGFKHTPHMLRALDDDEKDVHIADTLGGRQEVTIISESGLYNAIFRSRRPQARAFRRWITADLLPTLRRTGVYAIAPAIPAIDSAALSAGVAVVREARRLFGPHAARAVWTRVGLPSPFGSGPAAMPGDDPVVADLAAWCATVGECTIDQCAAALGLGLPDEAMRLRLGRCLRALGWFPRKARRGGRPVNLFTPVSLHPVEAHPAEACPAEALDADRAPA